MGASFDRSKAAKRGKTGERFILIPFTVTHSNEYRSLSHTARSLLLDLVTLYNGRNNGSLVLCQLALQPLGWNSNDTVNRATHELVNSGVIVKTRQGRKPNLASWFALGWKDLDVTKDIDNDPKLYRRTLFTPFNAQALKPVEAVQPAKNTKQKTKVRPPPHGVESTSIAPPHGVETMPPTPQHGAIHTTNAPLPTPPHGEYLDKPYPVLKPSSYRLVNGLNDRLTNTLAATPRMYAYHLKHRPQKWRDRWCELKRPVVIQSTARAGDPQDTLETLIDNTTRVREGTLPAQHWDEQMGAFRTPPKKHSSKASFDSAVVRALNRLHKT